MPDSTNLDSTKDKLLDELKPLLDNFLFGMKKTTHHIKNEESLAEGQISLMYVLSVQESLKVSEIANRIGITNGAVTCMTDKLVDLGFVRRDRCEEDRRVVWLTLTEKGQQVIKKVQDSRFDYIRNIFFKLSPEDLQKSLEVFSKLNTLLTSKESDK